MSQEIDPRGPQVAAALTSIVLATVLVTAPGAVALVLLGAQAVLFAVGASLGVTRTPYAWLVRRLVRPRLAAPTHLEDAAPPQFAQSVGFGFRWYSPMGPLRFVWGIPLDRRRDPQRAGAPFIEQPLEQCA